MTVAWFMPDELQLRCLDEEMGLEVLLFVAGRAPCVAFDPARAMRARNESIPVERVIANP